MILAPIGGLRSIIKSMGTCKYNFTRKFQSPHVKLDIVDDDNKEVEVGSQNQVHSVCIIKCDHGLSTRLLGFARVRKRDCYRSFFYIIQNDGFRFRE